MEKMKAASRHTREREKMIECIASNEKKLQPANGRQNELASEKARYRGVCARKALCVANEEEIW